MHWPRISLTLFPGYSAGRCDRPGPGSCGCECGAGRASGQRCRGRAAGASVGELIGIIAVNTYGKDVSQLSESEKQTISALASLAAGLAGGLAGDSTADAVAGAQAGKTRVENNALEPDIIPSQYRHLDIDLRA